MTLMLPYFECLRSILLKEAWIKVDIKINQLVDNNYKQLFNNRKEEYTGSKGIYNPKLFDVVVIWPSG